MNIEEVVFDKIGQKHVAIPNAVMAMLRQEPEIERPEDAQDILIRQDKKKNHDLQS